MSHNTISVLPPSTGSPPTPTPQTHKPSQRVSKAILKTAIQKANSAVVLDKANDFAGAIEAYTEAVNLLDRVLSSETRESDRQRLQETYNKYLKRIQYLNTLKSDADDLYETFENGVKPVKDQSKATKPLQPTTPKQQSKDMWIRKTNSSSSLDKKSTRLEGENTSMQQQNQQGNKMNDYLTKVATPSSPIPLDIPLSPVSSKSTPSRPSSNRKSNDTVNCASADPPPLEPRSIHRPSPRKSSRTGAAAALQQQHESIATIPTATFAELDRESSAEQRRSSLSSVSSMSSGDSDIIRVSSSHQPTMALPSLLHSKIEVKSIPNTVTPPTVMDHPSDKRNSDDSRQEQLAKLVSTESMVSLLSNQDETTQPSGGFGRLRTSSLPRKLHFTRPVIGNSTRMHRMVSNASSLDMADTSSSPVTGVPMRRNVTQPNTPVTPIVDPDTVSSRTISAPAPPQRQSSGLSMRKKYNRLSRTSMDGAVLGNGSNNGSGGGRKDKSSPIFSNLFGSASNSPYSPSGGRSTDEALNYFGKDHGGDLHLSVSPDSATTFVESDVCSPATLTTRSNQPKQEPTMNRYLDTHLKLIIALEHSMNYGGYITPKLFIPKNLWHQTNIRIASMDIKVAACESLILDLNRIEKWRNLDDIRGSLRLIESLEEVVDGLQVTLSKKLKQDSIAEINDDTSSMMYSVDGVLQSGGNQPNGSQGGSSGSNNGSSNSNGINSNGGGSINKRTQFMSWGSKLSKSVERMNAFSLNKVEDQHRHYIEVLQKLFIKLHMLEMWFQHYLKKDRQKNPHYDALLTKLGKVCDGINRVVGGFVLRDVAILLGKWLKRGGIWVNE